MTITTLKCQWDDHCDCAVTHADNKGFLFCTEHGISRRRVRPCRKLLKREIKSIEEGGVIPWRR